MESYIIKTVKFEGPFDLLLFFIERDELDINDIPISKITEEFLAYIQELERLNIEVASEFIYVAASLMRIKAKILIPRKELDEEGIEIDPRDELKNRLIEYKKYKSVLDEMQQLEKERMLKSNRGNVSKELKLIASKALVDVELESLTLFKLFSTFQRLLDQLDNRGARTVHQVINYNYTIEEQRSFLLHKVQRGKKTSFEEVFLGLDNRIHAIVTFLSLLELLNAQFLRVIQGEGSNNFWLTHQNKEEEE